MGGGALVAEVVQSRAQRPALERPTQERRRLPQSTRPETARPGARPAEMEMIINVRAHRQLTGSQPGVKLGQPMQQEGLLAGADDQVADALKGDARRASAGALDVAVADVVGDR